MFLRCGKRRKLLHKLRFTQKINDFLSNVYPKIIAEWPEILALLDRKNLDAAGITAVQNNYLNLRGSGVLIGFIDTGIDYTKKNFIYEDDTSKIIYIWDQTIQGNPPKDFCYGTEFNFYTEKNRKFYTPLGGILTFASIIFSISVYILFSF